MMRALYFFSSLMLVTVGVGCGGDERRLSVELSTSAVERLDPFAPAVGLERVRVFVEGEELYDDAVIDLDPAGAARSVEVEGLASLSASVRVEGYDASGSVVAFGRAGPVDLESTETVAVAFRRNLAYVTHRPNPNQDEPSRSIYAIDLASRTLVDEIRLPGTAPVARAITARGGQHMIVTWRDGAAGKVSLLSLDDHAFTRTIDLETVQDVALGVPGVPTGVALGGGKITFLDLDAGTATDLGRDVGGRVLDAAISADGRRVLASIDISPPGLLLVDLEARTLEAQSVVPDPSGVALDARGEVAYVTSRSSPRVFAFDLVNRRASALTGGSFAAPVDLAVFSESLRAVLGVDRSSVVGRILSFHVPSETGSSLEAAVETLQDPTGIATDGTGRRLIVVAAGSSTASAGLTIVDSFVDRLEGSGRLYPGDPDDTFLLSPGSPDREPVIGRQRYQPSAVAVVYGR